MKKTFSVIQNRRKPHNLNSRVAGLLIAFPVVFFFMLFLTALPAFSQSQSLVITDGKGREVTSFSASHALVIGESRYTKGLNSLPGVAADIKEVTSLFKELGFTVQVAENLKSAELKSTIETFLSKYGIERDNRLLIYFSGHGHTDKLGGTRDMGYIVPVDAPDPGKDRGGFRDRAIPMSQFEPWAKNTDCRHVLFIFDSCFSGTIFSNTRAAVPPVIDNKIGYPVRQFISSGSADQTVPDKSIFREQLVSALRDKAADYDNDGYVTGTELSNFLETKVTNYSKGAQTPQSGKLLDPNLDKGDFVFEVGPHQERDTITVTGSLVVSSEAAGIVMIDGRETAYRIKEGGSVKVPEVSSGKTLIAVKYDNGLITDDITVNIPDGKTASVAVKKISTDFELEGTVLKKYTGSAAHVTIPRGVTEIGVQAFSEQTNLSSINIPNSVTEIGGSAFSDCVSLSSINIPNSVTKIGSYAFFNCTNLSSINIPNSVTKIGYNAFFNCTNLSSINIPNSVTEIGICAFSRCTNLSSITVTSDNTYYKSVDGVLFTKDGSTLVCHPAGKRNSSYSISNSVTAIGEYAFSNCINLSSISIPNSVTKIGVGAFSDCTNLSSITIPNSVTKIGGGAFFSCNLTTATRAEIEHRFSTDPFDDPIMWIK